MNEIDPNPWYFTNNDENLRSPNGKFKVEYKDFGEIAMGGPIRGSYQISLNGRALKLVESVGGPIVWNDASNKIAIPVWTKNRKQKIAVFDVHSQTLTMYRKEFSVLHLSQFEGNTIYGINSPVYKPVAVHFEIGIESIEKTTCL